MSQAVITRELYAEYSACMQLVEASYYEASHAIAEYWYALYIIWKKRLWKAASDADTIDDWMGDFSTQPFGQSRMAFYERMRAIETWYAIAEVDGSELSEDDIKGLLGDFKVAIGRDLANWMDGKRLRPEVARRLDGKSPIEFIKEASKLGPGEARKAIREQVGNRDNVYFPDYEYDEVRGYLLASAVWDNSDDGHIGKWTIRVTAVPEDDAAKSFGGGKPQRLPETIAKAVVSKLGMRW